MRLFGLGKSKTEDKPLEEYLQQRTGSQLIQAASEEGFQVHYNLEESDFFSLLYVKLSFNIDDVKKSYYFTLSDQEAIPKKCYEIVDTEDVLKMATEKNSMSAPFYLAIMYEHGMVSKATYKDVTRAKLNEFRDQELAEAYHRIAAERGSVLEKAYQYIKENEARFEIPYDRLEDLATNMAVLRESKDNKAGEILGSRWEEFVALGGSLMAFYAGKGFPKCMAALCGFLGVSDQINATTGREEYWSFPLYKNMMMANANDRIKVANKLGDRLVAMATYGDEQAVCAMKQYHLGGY